MDDTKLNGWVPRTTPPATMRRVVKDSKERVHGAAGDILARSLEILREQGPPMSLAEAVKQAQTEFNSDTKFT